MANASGNPLARAGYLVGSSDQDFAKAELSLHGLTLQLLPARGLCSGEVHDSIRRTPWTPIDSQLSSGYSHSFAVVRGDLAGSARMLASLRSRYDAIFQYIDCLTVLWVMIFRNLLEELSSRCQPFVQIRCQPTSNFSFLYGGFMIVSQAGTEHRFLPVPFTMKPHMSFKLSRSQIRPSRNLRIHSERKSRRGCCTTRHPAR